MTAGAEILVALAAIIVFAQLVETVTGFGATVIALALGVHLLPLDKLVVALVLIGLLQSTWLVARGIRYLELRLLLTRILPLTAVGLGAGSVLFRLLDVGWLQMVLGGFVVAVSVLELVRLHRGKAIAEALGAPASFALLLGGGIAHGLFASGGPLVVYYASRQLPEKKRFRATLSLLWLLLNTALAISYLVDGRIDAPTLSLVATIVPALVVGIVIGEILHARVNEVLFRKVVQLVLLLTGIVLLT